MVKYNQKILSLILILITVVVMGSVLSRQNNCTLERRELVQDGNGYAAPFDMNQIQMDVNSLKERLDYINGSYIEPEK